MRNMNIIRTDDKLSNTILRVLNVNHLDRDFGPGPSMNEVLK